MASQKQIDANRKNAQKSTGPRTEEGKANSRRNALRDGLTGQILTLSDTDRHIFEQLRAEVVESFNPQTVIERKLAHAIAWDTWRLDHLRAIEMNLFVLGQTEHEEPVDDDPSAYPDDLDTAYTDVRTFRSEAPRLELMSLYESRMTRNLHRNISLLRSLQAERKLKYERDKKEDILIGRMCEINHMPVRASMRPSQNGFHFSDEEIAIGTVRNRYLECADWTIRNGHPSQLYQGLHRGIGDPLLGKLADDRPTSGAEWDAILNVPIETSAIHRLHHPEEYGVS